MNKINIAIDGPAGVGKSTIAKIVAKQLGYTYINSGLIYRTIAYNVLNQNISLNQKEKIIQTLKPNMIKLFPNEVVILDGKKLTNELHDDKISSLASKIAVMKKIREYCVKEQQIIATGKGVVMDGRDIASVVLPDAEIKIFLWSSIKERAKRKIIKNKKLGYLVDKNKIIKDIKERDLRDSTRKIGPLTQVTDAVKIDSTNMTIDEVKNKIIKLIKGH